MQARTFNNVTAFAASSSMCFMFRSQLKCTEPFLQFQIPKCEFQHDEWFVFFSSPKCSNYGPSKQNTNKIRLTFSTSQSTLFPNATAAFVQNNWLFVLRLLPPLLHNISSLDVTILKHMLKLCADHQENQNMWWVYVTPQELFTPQ